MRSVLGACTKLETRMKIAGRTTSLMLQRLILGGLAMACAGAAQTASAPPKGAPPDSATSAASAPAPDIPSALRTVLNLNGPWRFQQGDDLEWAEPGFDDSRWQTVTLSDSL